MLRLLLPAEIKAEESTAQRSSATGHLLVSMPKCNPELNILCDKLTSKIKESPQQIASKKNRLGQDIIIEADAFSKRAVTIKGLVKDCESEDKMLTHSSPMHLQEKNTKVKAKSSLSEEGPPPLF